MRLTRDGLEQILNDAFRKVLPRYDLTTCKPATMPRGRPKGPDQDTMQRYKKLADQGATISATSRKDYPNELVFGWNIHSVVVRYRSLFRSRGRA